MLRPETVFARRFRKQMSLPEVLLWQRLRGSPDAMKFRRQHPIGPYIADFYASATRTVVEVDGEAHDRGDRPFRDEARWAFFEGNGYRVLRIAASDILRDPSTAAEAIVAFAASPLHHASHGPPPRAGED